MTEPVRDPATIAGPKPGIALCLSGGGYRAMVFHLGALWRLNELGFLPKLDQVSSVSGGSIIAGVLALNWTRLSFDGSGVASNFAEQVARPIRQMAGINVDSKSILEGLLLPGAVGDFVAGKYEKHLFGSATLQDLPDKAQFVFNATNVQSAALFRMTKANLRDYRVGRVDRPTIKLAQAVAASSAFPPVLSPVMMKFPEGTFLPEDGNDLHRPPFTTELVLSDGGVYDNMGLEPAWKHFQTILVSDGGQKTGPEEHPPHDWAWHGLRINSLIDNQVRSLRKRALIDSYTANQRQGTYWGIGTNIEDYQLPDRLDGFPHEDTLQIAALATRLKAMTDADQVRIINWGYAVCDAAMRTHVLPGTLPPSVVPEPGRRT